MLLMVRVDLSSNEVVARMCFGAVVARALHGLRTNKVTGVPIESVRELANQNGHNFGRLLNRLMGRRRAHIEDRGGHRWLVLGPTSR
jgi:hypothetical protein